jgi:hypothetical protein
MLTYIVRPFSRGEAERHAHDRAMGSLARALA